MQINIEQLTAARSSGSEAEKHAQEESMLMRPGMLVRLAEVCDALGVSRSTIYKWMNEGAFPRPVRISERAVRWRSEDIEAWRESLVAFPR